MVVPNKVERQHYRLEAYGATPDEALAAVLAKMVEIDRLAQEESDARRTANRYEYEEFGR